MCVTGILWFYSQLEGAVTSAALVLRVFMFTDTQTLTHMDTLHVKWKGNIQEVAALWRQYFMFPSVEHLLQVRLWVY